MTFFAPTGWLQFASAVISGCLLMVAVLIKWARTPKSGEVSAKSSRSLAGIALQFLAFFLACAGDVRPTAPVFAPLSLAWAGIALLTGLGALWLFVASARALGANWSLVARTRPDHGLVREGPFARVRHPIYLAMLLDVISLGVGFGHFIGLAVAIPIFLVGTAIRTQAEERLLTLQFGDEYRSYARRTPALIPRLS